MGFFSQIQVPVSGIINELLADEALAEDLVYKKFDQQAFSEKEGHNVDETDDFDIVGVRLRHNLKSAMVSSGSVEKGDQYFLFRFSDMPDDISLKDKIADSAGKEYSVVAIDPIFGLAITVTVDGS